MPSPSRLTRRQFIRLAASGAAAAAAGPYVITSSALGANDKAAASNRVALGCIGIGNMGGGHLGSFLGDGRVQVVAVCDVDTKVRQAARDRAGRDCTAYHDFRELLARDDIDAVCIAVPDHWHALVAVAAARAGKDIYCEKPLSLTIRQARAMAAAARRYGRVFQTGSQQRSDRNFRYACELVRNGRIGKLLTVNVGVGGPSSDCYLPAEPIPEGFDWDFWLGPAPQADYSPERRSGNYGGGWRRFRDYSGGMMTDWGAHHFDIAQWGMGMDDSGPVEIIPPDGKDYKTLTYKYANGVVMYHGGANGVLFTGTDGKVEVNRGYIRTWPDAIGQQPIGPNEIHLYESRDHHANWLDCIASRRRPIADVEIGCRSVTVCHLGNIAWWLGRAIKWDPAKEEIIGDELAARWLDRPMRAPWTL